MKRGASLLNDQGAEYAVELMRIRKQVIMKKYRPQLFIRKKAFHKRFIFSGSRDIVPAVCRSVGSNRVELDQMHMMPHNVRPGPQLKRGCLQILRKQICGAQFNTVPCIRADYQRLCPDFLFLHHADIGFQASAAFQLFFQNKETSFRVVPAIPVVREQSQRL